MKPAALMMLFLCFCLTSSCGTTRVQWAARYIDFEGLVEFDSQRIGTMWPTRRACMKASEETKEQPYDGLAPTIRFDYVLNGMDTRYSKPRCYRVNGRR